MRMTRHKAAMFSSAVAISAMLAAGPARAQTGFNAPDPTVASGSVTFDRGITTPGTDVYTISTPTAVLDFEPSDTEGIGVINFQDPGRTAIFQGATDFAVLNRITPRQADRPIAFNGNVISQIAGQTVARGGSVAFYSPGGIVIADGAVFDIGNLLLTTARTATKGEKNWLMMPTALLGRLASALPT